MRPSIPGVFTKKTNDMFFCPPFHELVSTGRILGTCIRFLMDMCGWGRGGELRTGFIALLNSHLLYARHFGTLYHIEFYYPTKRQVSFIDQAPKAQVS